MTVRYRGGGHKQMYRIIDFKRTNDGMPATVKAIEYDPNRSARIALIVYANGEKSYILAPNGLKVGQTIVSGSGVAPRSGQHASAGRDTARYGDTRHRTLSRSGCRHGTQRRYLRAASPAKVNMLLSNSLRVKPAWC